MDKFIKKSEFIATKFKQQSIIEVLIDGLSYDSDQTCIIDCTIDRKWTKREVLESALNLAYYFSNELGIKKGDVVCIGSNNSDIHGIAFIGILAAGAVYSSFQEHTPEFEINGILTKTKPSLVICTDNIYKIIEKLAKNLAFIKKTLLIDSQSKSQTNTEDLTVKEIMGNTRDSDYPLPVKTGPNDLTTYVMTSGSTGQPKVIIRTNDNQLAMIECLQLEECNKMGPNDIQLVTGFCHISGQMFLMGSLSSGAKTALLRQDIDLRQVFETINKYQITRLFLTPPLLNYLAKNYDTFEDNYLNCIRNVMTGGAPISDNTFQTIKENFPLIELRNCYGMSEIGWGTMVYASQTKKIPSCLTIGQVCPNVEFKVIDENERSLPANERGEICIRSRQVTPGYLCNDEANSKLFTGDGFLKSGDVGYYDNNDYFYIVGRIKDMIIVGSINVYPVELEGILITHPDVQNAAVIAVKDKEFGEVPFAFVTLIKGSTVTEKSLIQYVDTRVNHYKKLRGGLKILDSFPLTPMNKINKTELKNIIPNLMINDLA